MFKSFISLSLIFLCSHKSFGQKEVMIDGEETVLLGNEETIKQIKERAIELAKVNALEGKFGRIIYQNNQTVIEDKNGITNSNFISEGNSLVKGKWIRTLKEDCIQGFDQSFNQIYITCKVKGIGKELLEVIPDFEAYSLECPKFDCKENQFSTGQDLFMFFKSSQNGFLTTFLTDRKKAYKLWPLAKDDMLLFPVKANQEYFLFSENPTIGFDGYFVYTSQKLELNTLYVIFSKQNFSLPILNLAGLNDEIKIPENTTLEFFHKWINNLRVIMNDIQIKEIPISIIGG
jgi:hypothetical protein